ncbi:MAG: hypothetical protein ACYTG7_06360, partial [Planctomycetota bacterium]
MDLRDREIPGPDGSERDAFLHPVATVHVTEIQPSRLDFEGLFDHRFDDQHLLSLTGIVGIDGQAL